MISRSEAYQAPSLFSGLAEMLDQTHPLFRLAGKIDWQIFDDAFEPLFCKDNGRPAKPIRLMVGLLILKHVRNLSDESIVEQWRENAYYQYFCGMTQFSAQPPCEASELVHFRHRVGEEGIELILKESIRVNDEDENHHRGRGRRPQQETTAFIDSTVQEKNITFPTDAKLLVKIVDWCQKVSRAEGLVLRQTYRNEMKELKRVMRFRGRAKSKKAVARADRRLRTIAGRLCRELDRLLDADSPWRERLKISLMFINGEKLDGHKIYSLHEPDVVCIAKGKDRVKYEFGNKVSIIRTWSGLIIGAKSFRNEYDGHTIDPAMEQVGRLYPHPIKILAGDRGYRGKKQSGRTMIEIPGTPKATDSPYQKRKKHRRFCKRAGIEPVIGHLKSDNRLGRNFYKGLFGDSINVMLAAAAFNFRRAMKALFVTIFTTFRLLSEAITALHAMSYAKYRQSLAFASARAQSPGTVVNQEVCPMLLFKG